VLIDVTPAALQAGFRFPVAVTAALMAVVETIPEQHSHEDIEGCGTLCRVIDYAEQVTPFENVDSHRQCQNMFKKILWKDVSKFLARSL
jgi:hypothetical protein